MRKVSSAEKRPKLRHFFISCGSAKNYLPQEKPRNFVTFCTFAEDTPYFLQRVAKKIEKKPCKPLCSPLFLCYSATFIDFRGGTSAKPEKSPKLRCFCCGRYKKASSAKRLSKTRKKPEIAWKNDCGGYAEGILRTIFRNFRRFFLQNLRGW